MAGKNMEIKKSLPNDSVENARVQMLDIDEIRPFRNHPFHLYESERLNDMVESIKEQGILVPVIVRKMHFGYEMLAGHNRQNAGKLACGHGEHRFKSRDGIGEEYGLSGSSVARLLRVKHLIPEMKEMLDCGELPMMEAVQLSFLPEKGQQLTLKASKDSGIAINKRIAEKLRKTPMIEKNIYETVAGPQPVVDPVLGVIEPTMVYKPVKLPGSMREKYFADMEQKEIEEVLEKLLVAWLKRKKRQEEKVCQ